MGTIRLAALSLAVLAATEARAATFRVDTTLDDVSKSACADETAADCSLRGAVAKANGDAEQDTIVLPAGTYGLTVASPCFFAAAAGDSVYGTPVIALCLNSDIELVGEGASQTIIQSNGSDRVLAVSRTKTASIRGVTLTGGRNGFGYAIGGGGGINNHGTVTLSDSIVTNNRSSAGGGIYNLGILTVVRSTISDNAASTAGGGGINNTCCGGPISVTVIDSTIRANSAHNGAGINNNGFVTVQGSTLEGNAANVGGGIYNGGGQVTVRNSTISGNSGLGAGIDNGRSSPEGASLLRIESTTITKNGGLYGGGFYITGNQPVTLRNTIVADNTTSGGFGPDCAGRFTSEGYNLIQSTAQCEILGDTTGNVTGVPARLGDLADNGGPTRTHAPLGASGSTPASPAIEAGNPADPASGGTACTGFDQRGVLRPIGARCDIGAFERGASLTVTKVSPSRPGNAGPVVAQIAGSGFDPGATVKLTRSGEPDVEGSPVRVETAGASLAATFDLTGRALGAWDVVVTNEDGTTVTCEGALTIETTRQAKVWADLIGRNAIRAGVPVRFAIVYGNTGNVDAVAVPVAVSYPKGFVFDLVSPLLPPPDSANQAIEDWSLVPIVAELDQASEFHNIPLLLPIVPAGFIGTIDFVLTLPANSPHGSQFELAAKIEPVPWLHDAETRNEAVADLVEGAQVYAERGFATTVPPNVADAAAVYGRAQLEAIVAAGRDDLVARLGRPGPVYSPAQLTIDLAAFMREQTLVASRSTSGWDEVLGCVDVLASLVAPQSAEATAICRCVCGGLIPEGCSCPVCDKPYAPPGGPKDPRGPTASQCLEIPNHKISDDGKRCIPKNTKGCPLIPNTILPDPDCIPIPIVNSVDPNEKTPTPGAGPAHAVTGEEPLQYGISFENLATASAAAQVVTITDQLDTASLDLATFAFGPMTIGEAVTIVPAASDSTTFTGAADLRPAQNIIVRADAYLDPATGIATWTFTSLDPATGQLTDDPFAGFLPPNTNPPDGQGRVLYTVSAKPTVPSGTVIKNKASIVFDVNEAIETAEISNLIDKAPPASQVDSIQPAECGATDLTLHWSGTDVGAGIATYTILVSTDGGPYAPFVSDTTDLAAPFTAEVGKTYRFHSIARDLTGHVEAAPAEPDVTRTVGACGTHDLAIVGITTPAKVSLTAKKPEKLTTVRVLIENRGPGLETIPDAATLARLVTVDVESLGAGCTAPVATLHVGKPQKKLPIAIKSKRRVPVLFDVVIGCAIDPASGAGHQDYRVSARVNRSALGDPDSHPADDVCPRSVTPPYEVDPFPDGKIRDKGCGAKKADKTRGGDILIDVTAR